MKPNHAAAIAWSFLAGCALLAACAGAKTGGGELVVVESHQFT